jgi:uncharacterized membrane protein YccC
LKVQTFRLLFSVNSFAAAMVALYIGFALGLPRPYWAMTTAYIVSQPLSGAMRSKGVYRIFGTLLGGSAALAMVPPLANAPVMLSLALALWVGLCIYVSLLDRTPRSYVFLLAGYTAAIIAFPLAPAPIGIFDVMITRVEEIGLGVICATVIHSLVFPQGVGPALNRRIQAWSADSRQLAIAVLLQQDPALTDQQRRKLAADIIDIRILSTNLPFDTSNFKEAGQAIHIMQDRMGMLLPLIMAVGDRAEVLRAEGGMTPEVAAVMADMRAWLADLDSTPADAMALLTRLRALEPALGQASPWRDLVLENLLDRMSQFVETIEDIRELRHMIERGARRLPPRLSGATTLRAGAGLHKDHYMAFLSGLAAVVAILGCCGLWIGLDWQEGSIAPLTAAIFCSFFATQDDPAPLIAVFIRYTFFSIPVVALYQFAILPRIDGFPMLVLVLAPTLLIGGYFVANPKTSLRAFALVLWIGNGLALAETYSADFSGFLNSDISQLVGLFAAMVATQLCRSVGVDFSARRILRAGWREIANVAETSRPVDRTELAVRMLDRVGMLTNRLPPSSPDTQATAVESLRDVRVSLNIQELKAAELSQTRMHAPARRLLAGVARGYRALARTPSELIRDGHRPPLDPALLHDLDRALESAAQHAPADTEMRGVARALVSLRRALFPQAPPYSPMADAPMESPA